MGPMGFSRWRGLGLGGFWLGPRGGVAFAPWASDSLSVSSLTSAASAPSPCAELDLLAYGSSLGLALVVAFFAMVFAAGFSSGLGRLVRLFSGRGFQRIAKIFGPRGFPRQAWLEWACSCGSGWAGGRIQGRGAIEVLLLVLRTRRQGSVVSGHGLGRCLRLPHLFHHFADGVRFSAGVLNSFMILVAGARLHHAQVLDHRFIRHRHEDGF